MALDPNDKRINPEDELFWKKVREAFDTIQSKGSYEITVQIGTREALVYIDGVQDTKATYIKINEVEVDPPILVVP